MKAGKSMRELSESDDLRTFFDRRLIKALSHPVREHILAVLNERVASGREIGEEIGADVSSFYHHIEQLEKLGCIERVRSERRRGAVEHFFRARQTVFFDDEQWRQVPPSLRADIAGSFMQLLIDDAASALKHGTLGENADEHVTWLPARVDRQSWEEVVCLMNQTLECLTAIQEKSAQRLAGDDAAPMTITVGILAFETPSEASPKPRAKAREPE
ncbi:MAG TPA: winged helix-turn-helix domain-containing protein [Solirubrobacterales bacterium]|nr:winged helix-turn-helix domain-containing protein [Solirubrobacterales bacterium]